MLAEDSRRSAPVSASGASAEGGRLSNSRSSADGVRVVDTSCTAALDCRASNGDRPLPGGGPRGTGKRGPHRSAFGGAVERVLPRAHTRRPSASRPGALVSYVDPDDFRLRCRPAEIAGRRTTCPRMAPVRTVVAARPEHPERLSSPRSSSGSRGPGANAPIPFAPVRLQVNQHSTHAAPSQTRSLVHAVPSQSARGVRIVRFHVPSGFCPHGIPAPFAPPRCDADTTRCAGRQIEATIEFGGQWPEDAERLWGELPEWFGIPKANARYDESARVLPSYATSSTPMSSDLHHPAPRPESAEIDLLVSRGPTIASSTSPRSSSTSSRTCGDGV